MEPIETMGPVAWMDARGKLYTSLWEHTRFGLYNPFAQSKDEEIVWGGQSFEEAVEAWKEPPMNLSLDFDNTYTLDPPAWVQFIEMMRSHGQGVCCIFVGRDFYEIIRKD